MSTELAVAAARDAALHVRRTVLHQSKRAGVGHIGSALSVADLLSAMYAVSGNAQPGDPNRDRIVLSKGHAALALYAVLNFHGVLTDADLNTYCADATLLGVHPEFDVPGIDFSTGSLGQGLPMAVGAALAARLQGSERRVMALLSDAECNEGSIWEAAMFAGHHQLANLVALIDLNGQQALDYTKDVSVVADMAARWRSFGWDAHECDGHDVGALVDLLQSSHRPSGPPTVIVAKTTFGSGVSFMEREIKWHYLPMNDLQYEDAVAQIESRV